MSRNSDVLFVITAQKIASPSQTEVRVRLQTSHPPMGGWEGVRRERYTRRESV